MLTADQRIMPRASALKYGSLGRWHYIAIGSSMILLPTKSKTVVLCKYMNMNVIQLILNIGVLMPTTTAEGQTATASGLFQEQEILNEDKHEQYQLKDLPLNASIGFFFVSTAERTSSEYGDFFIVQGLLIDLKAASVPDLLSSARLISFIPNVLLQNKITSGSFASGEAYRIAKTWDRGQKFADRTVAKGYGYTLYHQNIPPEVKAQLQAKYTSLLNPVSVEDSKGMQVPGSETPHGINTAAAAAEAAAFNPMANPSNTPKV